MASRNIGGNCEAQSDPRSAILIAGSIKANEWLLRLVSQLWGDSGAFVIDDK